MGCGVELGGSHNKDLATFNLDNLRFNKVVSDTSVASVTVERGRFRESHSEVASKN